ncbi:MAG: ankyrin repeat domain-containing protein, partial [Parachlamydiaceae bacterium]
MSDIISSSFSTLSSSIYPPAIFQKTNGNFRIDQSMIKNRALIISIITGVGLALACLYSGQFIFLLPMGIVTALTTYLAIKKLEERRAHKAMHQLALEFFRDPHKEEVPAAAMKYILLSPKTVEELLETPQYLSKTSHKTGLNLLESSLSKNGYYTNQVYVKRLLICHHFTNKPFDQNIINSVLERPDLLSLLLQQDLLSPNDLTQDQQFLVWKHADHDLARLLKKKGFDPNQPNENGLTPILSSIYKKDLNQILFLIQHGADIPADDIKLIQKKTTYESFKLLVPTSISSKSEQEKGFKIPIRSEQETSSSSSSSEEQYEISLSEFLKNEPKILEALKKGRAKELQFMELEESKASLFSTESAIELSRFSIEVSNIHINLRTCLLAIPVIWALRISIVATGFSLLSCSIAIIGGLSLGAYRQWEISRATAKADEIALKELKLFQPTHRSIEYLA